MLWNNAKAEIKVLKLDNGFVVEWEQKIDPKTVRRQRQMGLEDDDKAATWDQIKDKTT